jgi:hemolysin-activating ACP:hemolysin acyltransferase
MIFGSKKKVAEKTSNASNPEPGSKVPAPGLASRANATSTSPRTTSSSTTSPSPGKRQQRSARTTLVFGQVISLLMRSPEYKHFSLADLEWLVVPPVRLGQCGVAEVKMQEDSFAVPVAAALWASVSIEVDRRLSTELDKPLRLRPDEWRSGDILWLISAVGEARMVPQFLKQLERTAFKGREVKLRTRGRDGKTTVELLSRAA